MKERIASLYTLVVSVILAVGLLLAGISLVTTRSDNKAEAKEASNQIHTRIQRAFARASEDGNKGFLQNEMDSLFSEYPRLQLITLYSGTEGIEYHLDRGSSGVRRILNDENNNWKASPVYRLDQGKEVLLTQKISLPEGHGMHLDTVFYIFGRTDVYPILRNLLFTVLILMAVTLLMMVILPRLSSQGASSQKAPSPRDEEDFSGDESSEDDFSSSLDSMENDAFLPAGGDASPSDEDFPESDGFSLDDLEADIGMDEEVSPEETPLSETEEDDFSMPDLDMPDLEEELEDTEDSSDPSEEPQDDLSLEEDDLSLEEDDLSLEEAPDEPVDGDWDLPDLDEDLPPEEEEESSDNEEEEEESEELSIDDLEISDDLSEFDDGAEQEPAEEEDPASPGEDWEEELEDEIHLEDEADEPGREDLWADEEESPEQEESSPEETPSPAQPELYSPRSGLGWENFMEERLNFELERAASFDQDLVLALIESKTELEDDDYHQLADKIKKRFKFQDLAFEYGPHGFSLILPHTDLEKGIHDMEHFLRDTDAKAGLSSRNGRLLSGSRMVKESSRALEKAKRKDEPKDIVAFKSDPERFRNYLSQNR